MGDHGIGDCNCLLVSTFLCVVIFYRGVTSLLFLPLTIPCGLTIIAPSTPVVGLGCFSGSYLLYGLSATGTWFLLVLSSWLSQSQCLSARPPASYPNLAILTRWLGKLLAIMSALWVILLSGLQFSNVYDSCWCNSCTVTRGTGVKSYVIFFATYDTVAGIASTAWVWGVAWSFVTVLVTLAFVFVGKGSLKRIGQ
jgi:hypothetical protein